jgi:hypothetical protein
MGGDFLGKHRIGVACEQHGIEKHISSDEAL